MLPKDYRKITSPDLIKSKIKTWIIESESMHHRASATNHLIAQVAITDLWITVKNITHKMQAVAQPATIILIKQKRIHTVDKPHSYLYCYKIFCKTVLI